MPTRILRRSSGNQATKHVGRDVACDIGGHDDRSRAARAPFLCNISDRHHESDAHERALRHAQGCKRVEVVGEGHQHRREGEQQQRCNHGPFAFKAVCDAGRCNAGDRHTERRRVDNNSHPSRGGGECICQNRNDGLRPEQVNESEKARQCHDECAGESARTNPARGFRSADACNKAFG